MNANEIQLKFLFNSRNAMFLSTEATSPKEINHIARGMRTRNK